MGSISREIYRFNINNNMREEDKKINEAYLNQDAIGLYQQRDPNGNLKFRPEYDAKNSNYKNFKGMNDGAKMSDARMPTTPDLSSDEEKEVAGYIYKSETSDITPENPEVVVVGIGMAGVLKRPVVVSSVCAAATGGRGGGTVMVNGVLLPLLRPSLTFAFALEKVVLEAAGAVFAV